MVKKAILLLLSTILFSYAEQDPLFKSLEISFGTSQMFVGENSVERLWNEEKAILPTSTALIVGEYRFDSTWSIQGFYNIPLGMEKVISDAGELELEWAAPTVGLGPNVSLFPVSFRDNLFTTQTALGSVVIIRPEGFNYTLTGSIRLHLAAADGFTMYLGTAGSLGIPGIVLWYGVGHRF